MRLIRVFLFLIIISCNPINHEVKLSDSDLEIINKFYSPDSSKILYDYSYWRGNNPSFGMSIVKAKDTSDIISNYKLPRYGNYSTNDLKPLQWISRDTFLMEMDPTNTNRNGDLFKEFYFQKNDVTFKIIEKDIADGLPPNIERFSISPDRTKLLVAYRYSGATHIEISVINFGDNLPKSGNIYTTNKNEICPILFGKWTDNDEVLLESKQPWPVKLTSNRLKVDINVKKIEYKPKYSGVGGGWYNKELFDRQESNFYFKNSSKEAIGFITKKYSWGDNYHTKLDNYNYEYELDGRKYQSYFRYSRNDEPLKIGDSVRILVNEKQPIIHKLLEEYVR